MLTNTLVQVRSLHPLKRWGQYVRLTGLVSHKFFLYNVSMFRSRPCHNVDTAAFVQC